MAIVRGDSGVRRSFLDRSRIGRRDFFWPLAVIAGLTLLVVTQGIHFSIDAFDEASVVREQTLARNGLNLRLNEVAQMVVPQVDWDDAVANLDNKFDPEWAEANIGKYFSQNNGFESSFVLDDENRPIFAAVDGNRTDLDAYRPIAPLARSLIYAVRAGEKARGPLKPDAGGSMISRPIQATALKLVNGHMVIMTASLVQPDFGTTLPMDARSSIVITNMSVGPEFLKLFSQRFLFNGVHVRHLKEAPTPGAAEIPAKDDQGRTIAWFAWTPLNPGYALLRQMLPPIALVVLVLSGIAFTQLRRIQGFADTLIEREAHNRQLAYYDMATGLPNRAYFAEQLSLEIASLGEDSQALAIIAIGFDGLPEVMDEFGAETGEEFMRIAARRLAAVCREGALLARIAADQFALLSLGSGDQEAEILTSRLRTAMLAPIALQCGRVMLASSFGSTIVDDPRADPSEAMRQAEYILHRIRQDGDHGPGQSRVGAVGA